MEAGVETEEKGAMGAVADEGAMAVLVRMGKMVHRVMMEVRTLFLTLFANLDLYVERSSWLIFLLILHFVLDDGGKGGDGGNGGNGGYGADGGQPAPGALAGRGGNVTVSTRDPKLLMLVECDVRGGFGGRGGLGGIMGSGGNAGGGGHSGKGGSGGRGGKEVTRKEGNKTVTIQKAGKSGQSGSSGSSGHSGSSGRGGNGTSNYDNLTDAPDGNVTYTVLDSNGAIIEQASERFNLTVSTETHRHFNSHKMFGKRNIISTFHIFSTSRSLFHD